ncbi:MAG: hypothetical protein GX896_01970 [Clostridiales bacterium]|nr:hypothetical protein [Clostridiales bacterium]
MKKIISLIATIGIAISVLSTPMSINSSAIGVSNTPINMLNTAVSASALPNITSFANDIAALVNVERKAKGLSPIKVAPILNTAATIRSNEISTQATLSHTRPNGTECFTIFDELNIEYNTIGENIASGYSTAKDVMEAWMNSQGHKENILNSKYEYIGVGVVEKNGRYYWTQLFAGYKNGYSGAYTPVLGQTPPATTTIVTTKPATKPPVVTTTKKPATTTTAKKPITTTLKKPVTTTTSTATTTITTTTTAPISTTTSKNAWDSSLPVDVPDKIQAPCAIASDNSINLAWDNTGNETGYIIYKYNKTKGDWEELARTSTSSYTINNLPAGMYKYAIKAYFLEDGKEIVSKDYTVAFTAVKTQEQRNAKTISELFVITQSSYDCHLIIHNKLLGGFIKIVKDLGM